MKRYKRAFFRYTLIVGTLLSLAACADTYWDDMEARPIRLTANRAFSATRAATDIQGPVFDAGEDVNVFITVSSGGTEMPANDAGTTPGDPIVFKTSADKGGYNDLTAKNASETPYYPLGDDSKADKIYAAYPSSVTRDQTTFTVQYDQTDDADYKASDLMLATPVLDHAKNKEVIPLHFEHQMAKLIISAIGDPGITMDGTITIGSTDGPHNGAGVYRQADMSLADGELTKDGVTGDYVLGDRGSIVMSNGGAVLIPPQEVTTADFIIVYGHTSSDATSRPCYFGLAQKKFEAGKVYKLNLAIGMDNFDDVVEISGWTEEYGELTVTPSGGYQGVSIDDMESVTYNGKEHKPTPKVYYGTVDKIQLTEGQDFIYNYVENVNAGNAQVLVIGQNYYAGLAAVNGFTIKKALASINFPENSDKTNVPFELDGELAAVKVENTGDGVVTYTAADEASAEKISVDPVDGTVKIQNIGTATVRATAADGQNYYYTEDTKTDTYSVEIIAKPATKDNFRVTYEPEYFTYNGEVQELTALQVVDVNNEIVLANGIDYEATLTDSKDVGNAILTIKGKKNYNAEFTVEIPVRVATPTITVDETALCIGIHKNTAPKNRRKTRVATTEDWASAKLRYSLSPTSQVTSNDYVTINEHGLITGLSAGTTTVYVDVDADDSGKGNWNAATQKSYEVTVVSSDFNFELERDASGKLVTLAGTNAWNKGVPKGGHTEWVCPASGIWQLDCYGAQGAGTPDRWKELNGTTVTPINKCQGGRGAHIAGRIWLKKGQILHVVVGEKGRCFLPGEKRTQSQVPDGQYELCQYAWNGGANFVWGLHAGPRGVNTVGSKMATNSDGSADNLTCGGGGATDISLDFGTYTGGNNMILGGRSSRSVAVDSLAWKSPQHLYSRIIVAGGGGGALYYVNKGEDGYGDGGNGGGADTNWKGGDGVFNDNGQGGELDRGGWGGVVVHWYYNYGTYPGTSTNYFRLGQATFHYEASIYDDGPYAGGYSCLDGMFGEGGGYTYQIQGDGCGGGGWYGGGPGGEMGPNGSGAGGSSFLWTNKVSVGGRTLASYYDVTSSVKSSAYVTDATTPATVSAGGGGNPEFFNAPSLKYPAYVPGNSKYKANYNTSDNTSTGFPYFTEVVTADAGAHAGDGKAVITAYEIDDVQP